MGGKCELTSDLHCCPQGESGEELSPVPSDWLPDLSAGQRTSVCSTGSEDTMPSPISRQLSGSKCEKKSLLQAVWEEQEVRLHSCDRLRVAQGYTEYFFRVILIFF